MEIVRKANTTITLLQTQSCPQKLFPRSRYRYTYLQNADPVKTNTQNSGSTIVTRNTFESRFAREIRDRGCPSCPVRLYDRWKKRRPLSKNGDTGHRGVLERRQDCRRIQARARGHETGFRKNLRTILRCDHALSYISVAGHRWMPISTAIQRRTPLEIPLTAFPADTWPHRGIFSRRWFSGCITGYSGQNGNEFLGSRTGVEELRVFRSKLSYG